MPITKPIVLDETLQQTNKFLAQMVREKLDDTLNWKQVQEIVKRGIAKDIFSIGDQLVVKWTDPDTSTEYDMPMNIVHFGKVTDQVGVEHDGMFLQSHYALDGIQFSNYQAFYYAPDGLPAGTYHITWGNGWGTHVVSGKSYEFTLTQDVPAGGQLSGFEGAPDQAPTNWKVKSWASNTATSPIETVTVAEGDGGTSLGTISSSVKTDTLNAMQSMAYGYNRWNESAMEQYLNKSGNNWWTPKSNFDRRPDQYNKKAFMGGLPQDFLDVIGAIKVQTSANTLIDGGVTDITYDKFFLPSLEQIYVQPQIAGVEGEYWEYWKERTGASSPQAQYGTYPERISYSLKNHNSAVYVRLRSAGRGSSNSAWNVYSSGSVSYGSAIGASAPCPACVIY